VARRAGAAALAFPLEQLRMVGDMHKLGRSTRR
jgi:hypothetical protein